MKSAKIQSRSRPSSQATKTRPTLLDLAANQQLLEENQMSLQDQVSQLLRRNLESLSEQKDPTATASGEGWQVKEEMGKIYASKNGCTVPPAPISMKAVEEINDHLEIIMARLETNNNTLGSLKERLFGLNSEKATDGGTTPCPAGQFGTTYCKLREISRRLDVLGELTQYLVQNI